MLLTQSGRGGGLAEPAITKFEIFVEIYEQSQNWPQRPLAAPVSNASQS